MANQKLEFEQLVVGPLEVNCYIVREVASGEVAVIDPGAEPEKILARLKTGSVKYIINTHGHGDHIGGNRRLWEDLKCPILIHEEDAPALPDPQINLSLYLAAQVISPPAEWLLKDGDEIMLGTTPLNVFHTPGHTPGSICLYSDGLLFSGDLLFYESVGRCDLPGGSYPVLQESLKKTVLAFDSFTRVLPGHGPETTVAHEIKHNPFFDFTLDSP